MIEYTFWFFLKKTTICPEEVFKMENKNVNNVFML